MWIKSASFRLEINTSKKNKKTLEKVLTFHWVRVKIVIVAEATKNTSKCGPKLTQINNLKKFKKSVDNVTKRC